MRNYLILIAMFLAFLNIRSQNKNDLYLLTETGFNKVNAKNEINFGIGAEYFLSKKSSLLFRLKYLKSGIDYFTEGSSSSGGGFGFIYFSGTPSRRLLYKGSALKIPINYKWETPFITQKLKLFFLGGFAINLTLEDSFIEIDRLAPHTNKINLNLNLGLGIVYEINNEFDLYIQGEGYSGNPKTEKFGSIFKSKLRTEESLVNMGIRYKLK